MILETRRFFAFVLRGVTPSNFQLQTCDLLSTEWRMTADCFTCKAVVKERS